MTNAQIDFTPKVSQVQDAQRATSGGTYKKVKVITFTVGPYGPFTTEVDSVPGWENSAKLLMTAEANSLRSLGA